MATRTLLDIIQECNGVALAGYGGITLMTVIFPSLGPAANLWIAVPVTWVIFFGMKLFFRHSEDKNLRSIPHS